MTPARAAALAAVALLCGVALYAAAALVAAGIEEVAGGVVSERLDEIIDPFGLTDLGAESTAVVSDADAGAGDSADSLLESHLEADGTSRASTSTTWKARWVCARRRRPSSSLTLARTCHGWSPRCDGSAPRCIAAEALFAGGPDTSCRTRWEDGIECVSVPMDDLRAALSPESTERRT